MRGVRDSTANLCLNPLLCYESKIILTTKTVCSVSKAYLRDVLVPEKITVKLAHKVPSNRKCMIFLYGKAWSNTPANNFTKNKTSLLFLTKTMVLSDAL